MRTNGWAAALAWTGLALLPARLAVSPGLTRSSEPAAFEAGDLALAAPDLLGPALGLPLGPRLEDTAPAAAASPPPDASTPDPLAVPAASFPAPTAVPEPAWLGLLSLASAAAASRGRRRSPPRRPGR
jgi:hypothetical protein